MWVENRGNHLGEGSTNGEIEAQREEKTFPFSYSGPALSYLTVGLQGGGEGAGTAAQVWREPAT